VTLTLREQMVRPLVNHGTAAASLAERGLIDLTMPLSARTIPFPGHPPTELEPLHASSETEGLRNTVMRSSLHTGTHFDAPSHFVAGGASIDQMPIERFWRPAVRLDLGETETRASIDLARLDAAGFSPAQVGEAILLLATGWTDRAWRSKRLFEDVPVLGEDAAVAIAAARPAALGLDFAVDDGPPWPNHAALLGAEVALIENLMGLRALPREGFEVIAFPQRLAGESAAPARVVASIPRAVW
jgi:arylformamidase